MNRADRPVIQFSTLTYQSQERFPRTPHSFAELNCWNFPILHEPICLRARDPENLGHFFAAKENRSTLVESLSKLHRFHSIDAQFCFLLHSSDTSIDYQYGST